MKIREHIVKPVFVDRALVCAAVQHDERTVFQRHDIGIAPASAAVIQAHGSHFGFGHLRVGKILRLDAFRDKIDGRTGRGNHPDAGLQLVSKAFLFAVFERRVSDMEGVFTVHIGAEQALLNFVFHIPGITGRLQLFAVGAVSRRIDAVSGKIILQCAVIQIYRTGKFNSLALRPRKIRNPLGAGISVDFLIFGGYPDGDIVVCISQSAVIDQIQESRGSGTQRNIIPRAKYNPGSGNRQRILIGIQFGRGRAGLIPIHIADQHFVFIELVVVGHRGGGTLGGTDRIVDGFGKSLCNHHWIVIGGRIFRGGHIIFSEHASDCRVQFD